MEKIACAMLLIALVSCNDGSPKKTEALTPKIAGKDQIQLLNDQLVRAAKNDSILRCIDLYEDNALLLPEYMPIIDGKEGIKQYYAQIFQREELTDYNKRTEEVFDFGTTLLEIGTFKKTFSDGQTHTGPYWNIWTQRPGGGLRLMVETFGFFSPPVNPGKQVVTGIPGAVWEMGAREGVAVPLEFEAYAALMENVVRDRDTEKVISLYTKDGSYTPFVDTTKTGLTNLGKHYYAYHKNPVSIDSIEAATYDFIEVPNGVLRITQFYVEWTVPNFSGKNEGTGISYWRRQEDNSLRIHRQIAHHIQR